MKTATLNRTLRFFATCGKGNYGLSDQIGHSAPGTERAGEIAAGAEQNAPHGGDPRARGRSVLGRAGRELGPLAHAAAHQHQPLATPQAQLPGSGIRDEDHPRGWLRKGLAPALSLAALLFVAAPAAAQSNTISYNDYCSAYPAQCGTTGSASAGAGMILTGAKAPGRPEGYGRFCFEHQSLCSGISDAGAVIVTPETLTLFAEVNRGINATIIYCPDRPVSRTAWKYTPAGFRQIDISETDTWSIGPRCGDCEDYALTKMMALMAIGYPRSALRLAAVQIKSPTPENHLVLTIRTTAGDYVLDSLTESVRPWRDYPYRWIEIEQPVGGAMKWMKVAQ